MDQRMQAHSMTLGTTYNPACDARRVLLVQVAMVALGDNVRAQALRLALQRVRHGLHARGVDRRELLDEGEDLGQGTGVDGEVRFADFKPREAGDRSRCLDG